MNVYEMRINIGFVGGHISIRIHNGDDEKSFILYQDTDDSMKLNFTYGADRPMEIKMRGEY